MTKLVTVESFRDKYGLEDMDVINVLINNSLESVSLHLESYIPTILERGTRTELFWVHPNILAFNSEYVRLDLKAGSVVPNSVSGKVATTLKGITAGSPTLSEDIIVDYDKGRVHYLEPRRCHYGMAIELTYTSGYEVLDDGIFGTLYDGVPDWLQEAAYLLAMVSLKDRLSLQSLGTDEDLHRSIRHYLNLYVRESGSAYRSLKCS